MNVFVSSIQIHANYFAEYTTNSTQSEINFTSDAATERERHDQVDLATSYAAARSVQRERAIGDQVDFVASSTQIGRR